MHNSFNVGTPGKKFKYEYIQISYEIIYIFREKIAIFKILSSPSHMESYKSQNRNLQNTSIIISSFSLKMIRNNQTFRRVQT